MKKLIEPKTIGVRLSKDDFAVLKSIDAKPSVALRLLIQRYRDDCRLKR